MAISSNKKLQSLQTLRAKSFFQGDPRRANELISEARDRVLAECGASVNYEISLIGRNWQHLEQVVAPRLAFFLRSKRYHVWQCEPVFLTIFVDDGLFFVKAADFFQLIQEKSGHDRATFKSIAESWESTGRRSLAALPGGEPTSAELAPVELGKPEGKPEPSHGHDQDLSDGAGGDGTGGAGGDGAGGDGAGGDGSDLFGPQTAGSGRGGIPRKGDGKGNGSQR